MIKKIILALSVLALMFTVPALSFLAMFGIDLHAAGNLVSNWKDIAFVLIMLQICAVSVVIANSLHGVFTRDLK
jgi:hypothetical protein